MKLRTQIISLGLVGALLAASVGGIGLAGTSRLAGRLDAAISSSVALQSSQEADMMHDAIRGDVLLALMGAQKRDPARIEEARKGLQEHAQTFKQALEKMQSLPLSQATKDIVAKTLPLVSEYIGSAESTIHEIGKDIDSGEKAVPSFQAKFVELEKQMAEQSDAIEASNVELNAQAQAAVTRSALEVGLACLFAAVSMVFASLWLARHMARPMAHAVGVADRLAQGDLTAQAQVMGNDETQRLLESLARMRASFADIVQRVKSNADSVATASAHIAQGNQDLSGRTEQQASALQQTTATMDLLGSTVRNNADSARQANQLAQGASAVAVKGGEVVSQVVSTMKGIDESSRRISDIIAVIDGIAFQTNILALNAAVEAARAGEQGRGFAVVAGEVRTLAQRSAQAAREIKALIGTSVEQVKQGTTLVDQAGHTMNEIVGSIRRVSDIVGEITAASQEQSSGVTQVGQAVSQMDQATQQNAALVEQSAAAAESLKEQAKMLVQAVAAFKLGHGGLPAGAAA